MTQLMLYIQLHYSSTVRPIMLYYLQLHYSSTIRPIIQRAINIITMSFLLKSLSSTYAVHFIKASHFFYNYPLTSSSLAYTLPFFSPYRLPG